MKHYCFMSLDDSGKMVIVESNCYSTCECDKRLPLKNDIMTSNEIKKLQRERGEIKARLESGEYKSLDERTTDAKRLKEINQLLNDWYLKK